MATPNQWAQCRTIVLDEGVGIFVRENEKSNRFEEQWRGVEWLLGRVPENGTPCEPSEPNKDLVYVFPENDLAETQELWVLYSYTDNEVTIHSARFR